MAITSQEKVNYTELWKSYFKRLPVNASLSETLLKKREEALNSFEKQGFPTNHQEEWKYTSVLPILKKQISPATHRPLSSLQQRDLHTFLFKGLDCNLLVFINGFYTPALSHIQDQTIRIDSLSNVLAENTFAGEFSSKTQFSALNTAFFQDGAFVQIPEGVVLERPIQILFLHDTLGGNTHWFSRNMYKIGKNASAQFIHNYGFLGGGNGLGTIVNEVFVDENASLDFTQVQAGNSPAWLIEQTEIHQQKNSNVKTVTVSGGPEFIRNDLNFSIEGEGCTSHMSGLAIGSRKCHIDNHTVADHLVPNCNSNELYKYVLSDEATGVFNGKIFVRPHAQKTNAFQSNRNLLLSPGATINTKPQLEIFADDVKCSHGATTGKLNEEALFYLRSRAIDETEAKKLLVLAFADEIIQQISNKILRDSVHKIVSAQLQ